MSKRIKRKRKLEYQVQFMESLIDFLIDQNNQLWKKVEKMEKINSENVEATNKRFDQLESANQTMRVDLNRAVIEFKKSQKKSWFSRK